MVRRGSKYYDSPPSRIPRHILAQRAREDGEADQKTELGNEVVMEKNTEFEDRMGNVIMELSKQRDESIQERMRELEKRIAHLEAVVYEEGPPPDAGMLEAMQ